MVSGGRVWILTFPSLSKRPMHKAYRLAGAELTQTERFALLALRNRAQLFVWERGLMAAPTMDRLAALGLATQDGDRWDPTSKGIELIARLSGHDLSSIVMPDASATAEGDEGDALVLARNVP